MQRTTLSFFNFLCSGTQMIQQCSPSGNFQRGECKGSEVRTMTVLLCMRIYATLLAIKCIFKAQNQWFNEEVGWRAGKKVGSLSSFRTN